jgi:mRNA interferase MazF
VWWVSFDPSVGGEIRKTRPALVLSNNAANTVLNRVIVLPLTSQTAKHSSQLTENRVRLRPTRSRPPQKQDSATRLGAFLPPIWLPWREPCFFS